MSDQFDDFDSQEQCDESDCPASDYDWEPDVDEAQEWADLPYGYDEDSSYNETYTYEDEWDF